MKKQKICLKVNVGVIMVVFIGLQSSSYPGLGCPNNSEDKSSVFYYKSAKSELYSNNCGTCHFPYPPNLLPFGSWEKIMTRINDHFGELVELQPETKQAILTYLGNNSAERSPTELSNNILASLNGQLPLRITDIPYIIHIHDDINHIATRTGNKTNLSNCASCHKLIENEIYFNHATGDKKDD